MNRINLGAPGIYQYPESTTPSLEIERMDVCAFVGIAPRGPCREAKLPDNWNGDFPLVDPAWPKRRSLAIAVESMDEYIHIFGGFEGPGRLPYAVSSFFDQGGRKAYIVRIVHNYGDNRDNQGIASATINNVDLNNGNLIINARNEGSWGNYLRAVLGFSLRMVNTMPGNTDSELYFELDEEIKTGDLLRLHFPQTASEDARREFRTVSVVKRLGLSGDGGTVIVATLDTPLPRQPEYAEVVNGELLLRDNQGTEEHFSMLGLNPRHERWMATILFNQSRLVLPDESWINSDITPQEIDEIPQKPNLDSDDIVIFSQGEDRYTDIDFNDYFDANWVPGNPEPGDGIHALSLLSDLSSMLVPDLYVPESLPQIENVSDEVPVYGSTFSPCIDYQKDTEDDETPNIDLENLYLDPGLPNDLESIIELQIKLVNFADEQKNFVVLLDVPPGINEKQILRWRSHFRSSYAVAYHPWLKISNDIDQRNELILINPSAVAAGIIAKQEIRFGVQHGPANEISKNVIKVSSAVSPIQHDLLHPNAINVFLQKRDGVWLSAGRTLSRDKRYRQLSVRRLMIMLRRILQRQMQWAVFEPNGPELWSNMRYMLSEFLRKLYIAGAFAGASELEAFFVKCDSELNHRAVVDAGMMLAEIGVAPAEPIEFILLRISRGDNDLLLLES